jgi:hypothetical protein
VSVARFDASTHASQRVNPRTAIAVSAFAFFGCSSSSTSTDTADVGVEVAETCQDDPRAMTFQPSLSIASEKSLFHLQLADAQPAPPARNTNVWTLTVTDATGAPVEGATIVAKPWMPAHGHGSSVAPIVAPSATPGSYDVTRIIFVMPGLWQVIVTVTVTGADGTTTDTATFAFCVPS